MWDLVLVAVQAIRVKNFILENPTTLLKGNVIKVSKSQTSSLSKPISSLDTSELISLKSHYNNNNNTNDDGGVLSKSSKVPVSKVSRLFHYGTLVAGLGLGAAGQVIMRGSKEKNLSSIILSEANVDRLVSTFAKMRGAALKLGQMISIQGMYDMYMYM